MYVPANMRREVISRAQNACEYCLICAIYVFMPHEVDHLRAIKHGGETLISNLGYSCHECNRHKGSDLTSYDPNTDTITRLYNPREHGWDELFYLIEAQIEAKTDIGRTTVFLLQLNAVERLAHRTELLRNGQYPRCS